MSAQPVFGDMEQDFAYDLAARLLRKRKERGFSQQELAARVGVHRNAIYRWETGEAYMSVWDFLRVCYALSVQYTVLLPEYSSKIGDHARLVRLLESERDPEHGKDVQRERDPHLGKDELRRLGA